MNSMTKVLLISPQFKLPNPAGSQEPPLGLLYLGTVLSKHDFNVKILDASNRKPRKISDNSYFYGMNNEQIEQYVKEYNPHIVGLGCLYSTKWPFLIEIAKLIKKISNSCFVVAGGIYPSMSPKKALNSSKHVDFCLIGEAEYSFLDLCKILSGCKNGEIEISSLEYIKKIDGIVYRENDDVFFNAKKQYIENLDELPFPDYDLIEGGVAQYDNDQPIFRLGHRYLPIMSSRSCPSKCSFCNMKFTHGGGYRHRSPDNVIQEILYINRKWGITSFHFADDNVSLIKNRFKSILQKLIDIEINFRWASLNGMMINTLDEEVVNLMHKSGCVRVAVAIESGDEEIRKNVVRKPIKTEKIKEVVAAFKKEGIFISAFFIIGFLEDNDETIRKTRELIFDLNLNWVGIFALQVYPGTDIYKMMEAKDLIKDTSCITGNKMEMLQPTFELYDGYSSRVQGWQKSLYYTFFLSLLKHPFDIIKYHDVYLNYKYIKSFFITYIFKRE